MRSDRMRVWALLSVLLAAGLLMLLMVGTALAATPQEIYNDYADNGRLDGNYTQAELQAVLTDPTLAQYANQQVLGSLKELINSSGEEESTFPFTGAQMAIIAVGGVVLVGGGVMLRRGQKKPS